MTNSTRKDRMVIVGRVTAVLGVFGALILIGALALWPALGQPASSAIRAIDLFGMAVALSMPITWITAIWHWGNRFPNGKSKSRWGLAVIFGFVLGAAAYWFRGARVRGAAAPLSDGSLVKGG